MKLKPCLALCAVLVTCAFVFVGRHIYAKNRYADSEAASKSSRQLLALDALQLENTVLREKVLSLQHSPIQPANRSVCTPLSVPPSLSPCEVIHVGFVCAGYKSVRSAVTLLKSLLFYRKNPLHFHFVSDSDATVVLRTLFDTWSVPGLTVSYYSVETLKPKVSWIPNKHYSGAYGLLKMLIPSVLEQNLSKVILMDTDITLAADIGELWSFFYLFQQNTQILGLVENQSDWYIPGKLVNNPWPAFERGFNTGIVLMDLKAMRDINWQELWTGVVTKHLKKFKYTSLADQDIINAMIFENNSLLFKLPCQWNVQFSRMSKSDLCYKNSSAVRAVHWNQYGKIDSMKNLPEYFRNVYLSFLEYNGNLLRRELIGCPSLFNQNEVSEIDEKNNCYEFRREQYIVRRIHLYYLDFNLPANKIAADDVTLITQLSIDRLQMIDALSVHWPGPMSIALYLSDSEVQQFRAYVTSNGKLAKRKNIAYHIVYREGEFYPVNLLRNVAMNNSVTPYLFLCDIDFLPMVGLYQYARDTVKLYSADKQRRAFVVPAFETQRYRLEFPTTKKDVLKMLNDEDLHTFRYDVWPQGHAPTKYSIWRTANAPYKISWASNYEPYVIIPRTAPHYDERFVGFGWNKVSHIIQLDAEGYEFTVLPDAFIIHMPHAPSNDIAKFRTSGQYRR